MIKAKELLKRMTEHLSDWLIMRRNPESSNGGKVLLGIAQELEDIQDAIQEYVDMHFVSNYINKTHAIEYEHMYIHVGAIAIEEIKIISPAVDATDDMKTFESSCNYSYYENGYLYFKSALVSHGDTIQYIIGDSLLEEKAERVAIWNIFDEFAMYVGITRMKEENNEHLLERILFQSRNPINSSEEGIQNAIANIIGSQPKDVIVEKIDESNCHLNDFTGKTIFEEITEINRDIYRSKRWGIDYWQHDMDYVSYIPHKYDVNPGYFQDGIGDNDDLLVNVTRKNEVVHMEVKCYSKNEKSITEYYQKYPIDTTTKLKLYKPEGIIEPIEVIAQIEAGTLTDVTDSNFDLTYKAIRSACETERVIDLIDTSNTNLVPIYDFIKDHEYRLKIKSETDSGSFNAKVTLDNESLIKSKDGFFVNELGYMTHSNIGLYANQLSYFSEHINFSHEINGFRLKPYSRSGRLVLPLKNLGGKFISYTLNTPGFDPINESALSYKNFYKSEIENTYVSYIHSDPLFAIRQHANQIKFYIEGEAIVMTKSELGDFEERIKDDYFVTQSQVFTPVDYMIHIIPTNTSNAIKIKEIQYNNFEIYNSLQYGQIIDDRLPDLEDNTLTVSISTSMSMAPSIGFIFIGEKLSDLEYTTESFVYNNQTIDFTSKGDVIFTIEDLTSNQSFECKDNAPIVISRDLQDLKINTNKYKIVDEIIAESGGHIIKKGEHYYLRLEANEKCSKIIIKGEIIDYIKHYSLNELVDKKIGARYYVSPIIEGFIESLDYDMQIVKPRLNHLYGEYTIERCDPFIPIFKTVQCSFETYSCAAPIDVFYLRAASEKKYKAINKQLMYEESKKDIAVNKNFVPLLPYNELLFYKVTALTYGAEVNFYNKIKEELHGRDYESAYSIDLSTLNYKISFSLVDRLKQQYQEVILPIRLNKHVMLPAYIDNAVGDTLDLKEYLITPEEGMEVFYTSPQTEDIAIDPSFIRTEKFILGANGIKKLACCQIYEITYCGFSPYTENAASSITDFELINQLGVIQFTEYFTKNNVGRVIYIHYTIKKPSMLILSTNKLYDIVEVEHEAYTLISTEYHNAPVGIYKIDSEDFFKAEYVTVKVDEPGYIATASPKDKIINIVESGPRDRIAIHKGFYYSDGEEYYMFGSMSDSYKEFKNDYIEAQDVNYMENGMMLHRESENLICNSVFNCGPLAKLFATDFSELDNVNYFKRLNACEQINLWQHCNTSIQIDTGLYGRGISFAPIIQNKYQFIGMPIEQTGLNMTLSFWLKGSATPVIYEQDKWEDEIHLTLSKTKRVLHFEKKGYIYYIDLPYNPDVFYYLSVRGEGIIDDLILCDKSIYSLEHHNKNITKIFMPQFASEPSDKQRILFNHQKGYGGTTQMMTDGEIVPTSSMSYGYTKLLDKNWMKYAERYKATLVDNCLISDDQGAYALTPILKIDSKDFVKEIIVKANYISDKNVPLIVYTGNSEKSLRPVASTVSEYIKIDTIEEYIQVRCNLEDVLYSLDVSARYIEGAVPQTYRQNTFESELFDLGQISEYEIEKLKFKIYNNAQVYVRSGKTNQLMDEYTQIPLNNQGALIDSFQLGNSRYVQFKIYLNDSCNLEYFDILNTGGK